MSITPQQNGNIPEYRFYITLTSITYEVFPLNFSNTSIKRGQADGRAFYRSAFNGDLTFGTNSLVTNVEGEVRNRKLDFDLFWDIEQNDSCAKIYFLIIKTVSGFSDTYWEGHFSTNDGIFDLDNCTFVVSPHTDDIYTDFTERGDEIYNMITMPVTAAPTGAGPVITTTDTTNNYTRNRLFLDVIRYVVNQIVPGTGVISTFFTAAINPVTLAANTMLYVLISAKSDFKNHAGAAATVANITFDDLMDFIKIWNLRWDYDGANIIIEHESYFVATPGGLDTRTQLAAVASNKYRYTKEIMPKFEKFRWQESGTAFAGWDIWYDSSCVNQGEDNTVEYSPKVSTDVEFIDANEVSNDGFVITANSYSAPNYAIYNGLVTNTGETKYNAYMAWPNLHDSYFRHGRVLIEGWLNNEYNLFYSAKKTKQQDIQIVYCDTFNPTEELTTELGETYLDGTKAVVRTADISPFGVIKLELLYGPPDNENSGTDVFPKVIQIIEKKNYSPRYSKYYLTLSELSGVDLTVKIKMYIHSASPYCASPYWWTSEESCTITAGTLIGSVSVDWESFSGCSQRYIVEYSINMDDAPGWDYYLIEDPDSLVP